MQFVQIAFIQLMILIGLVALGAFLLGAWLQSIGKVMERMEDEYDDETYGGYFPHETPAEIAGNAKSSPHGRSRR